MEEIILLGATGSIGTQCLDVVYNHSDEYHICAMAIGKNVKLLEEIIENFDCSNYHVELEDDYKYLCNKYPKLNFSYGTNKISDFIKKNSKEATICVNALVGFIGLKPTLTAIECDLNVGLANKESLVVGGDLVLRALEKSNSNLYPIDSEHSAIWQCLQGNKKEEIKKLVITASGGSFRDKTRDELESVTVSDALNHPNWNMGKRITIDSATMMNKGFEVIEAHYLFDIDYENIDVIINKQSIIHSMVEYIDHSFIAQLGTADMRLPIQYALSYPNRVKLYADDELDLAKIGRLDFQKMDYVRFPLLKLAFDAGKRAGNSGAILNAADEECVKLFLDGKISFLDIEKYIFDAYKNIEYKKNVTLDDLIETDFKTRKYINKLVKGETND